MSTYDELAATMKLPSWRPHQLQAIHACLAGQDVLVIAPTGSGKTEPFLAAGHAVGGVTLILSPLRSLMADQARRVEALGLPVRVWNSDVSDKAKDQIATEIRDGWAGYFYTTPESLAGRELQNLLTGIVELGIVDEAHCCLRERGFRLQYGRAGGLLSKIGVARRYACTATLPAKDREALIRTIGLKNPTVITSPVARGNLDIQIIEREEYVLRALLIKHKGESGIVFSATVRQAEGLLSKLEHQGWPVTLYHGRMTPKKKKESQQAFMSGAKPIAVVTDAFLLGIDKPDIRFTAHWDFPKSIEDWVQGFGRCGRDGLPGTCYGHFLYASEGIRSRRFLLEAGTPTVTRCERVWNYLASRPFTDMTASQIGEAAIGREGIYCGGSCITQLRRYNLCETKAHPDDKRRRIYFARGDFDAVDWEGYEQERARIFERFGRLQKCVDLPQDRIAADIDAYFGAVA